MHVLNYTFSREQLNKYTHIYTKKKLTLKECIKTSSEASQSLSSVPISLITINTTQISFLDRPTVWCIGSVNVCQGVLDRTCMHVYIRAVFWRDVYVHITCTGFPDRLCGMRVLGYCVTAHALVVHCMQPLLPHNNSLISDTEAFLYVHT